MQKYVYRVLFKRPGDEWQVLTPSKGKSKLYARRQDAKALIAAQPLFDRTFDHSYGWRTHTINAEYKIQKALIGEWQDEAI